MPPLTLEQLGWAFRLRGQVMSAKITSITGYMGKFTWPFVFALGVLVLAGCRTSSAQPTAQETVAIYQAVIQRIYHTDDTFGGTLEKPILYVLRATDDSVGDPSMPQSGSLVLSQDVQQGIADSLSGLPARVIWVDSFDQVNLEPDTGAVSGQGVIITLGNIHYENPDKALVSASIYVANMAAGGKTYILEQQDGVWVITGTTGVEWIS